MLTHSKISHFIVTIDNTRLEVRNKSYNIKNTLRLCGNNLQ